MPQSHTPRQPSRNSHSSAHRRGQTPPRSGQFTGTHRKAARPGKGPSAKSSFNTGFAHDDPHLKFDASGLHVPTGNTEMLITRRQMLYGVVGVGALVGIGLGVGALKNANEESSAISTLSVATTDVITLDGCTEVAADEALSEVIEYQLPYGSLIWANSDTIAACLLPTSTVKPLAQIALLGITSGNSYTVVEHAVAESEGFEIYDVRCSDKGIIWAEANILTGDWRLYATSLSGYNLGTYRLIDSGSADTEMPTIAAVGDYAYWQIMPVNSDSASKQTSYVKSSLFTNPTNYAVIFTATGRMSTPITPSDNGVVITPRYPGTTSYRQVMLLGADGTVKDSLTLPSRMAPQDAAYGRTGLMFTFGSIYSYGGGIANLGTYAPAQTHNANEYGSLKWFRFGRTPVMTPSWCGEWLMVKSTTAVCAINLLQRTYCSLSVDNGAESYGDCLASVGSHSYALTYMNVDNTDAKTTTSTTTTSTEDAKYCLVRVWEPLS